MTKTIPTRKQTAGNNADLARIKALMNAHFYREALAVYNAEGREACRAYMGRHFNAEVRARRVAELFGE